MARDLMSEKYISMFRGLAKLVDEVDRYYAKTNENLQRDDILSINKRKQSKERGSKI